MPYPLSKLAYGLRCRLNEITTPVERYKLQVAAGNPSICPPVQLIQYFNSSPEFSIENGAVTMEQDCITFLTAQKVDYGENKLITSGYDVYLTQLSFQDLKSEIFDHTLFDDGFIYLIQCNLSTLFYTVLRTAFPDVKKLSVDERSSHNFSFTDMLYIFPDLKQLNIRCCNNNHWITEILQSKDRSPLHLRITFDTEASSFEKFEFDDLLTLLKTQKPGFHLFLGIKYKEGEFKTYFSELKQFLDQNLARRRKNDRTTISISNRDALYGSKMKTWHVPFNDGM